MALRRYLGGLLLGLFAGSAVAAEGMAVVESDYDVATTEQRLVDVLQSKGMTVFNRIDHSAGAEKAGLELAPTRLVIFGNPEIGTRLMQCGATAAIDLPMKALIWKDGDTVHLGYNTADYVADRHELAGCDDVIGRINDALAKFARSATSGG